MSPRGLFGKMARAFNRKSCIVKEQLFMVLLISTIEKYDAECIIY